MTILFLSFLFNSFVMKWYFPQGINYGESSVMQIADTDREGNMEFIFTTYGSWPAYIHFYELHLPNTWGIDSVPLPGGDLLWASGDFDCDGLYDITLQFHIENPSLADGVMIFESPDSFSYPSQEVWRDTVGPPLVLPISAFDIDQDGKPEIVKDIVGPSAYLGIYEAIGNNQYELIFTDNPDTSQYDGPSSTHAFGDFDGDGRNEFVAGELGGYYWVVESPGNNTYEQVYQGHLPTLNIKDCFSVPDADGDGKMEFVVKGYVIPSGQIHCFIFEATGDNTYEIIDTLILPLDYAYYGGYSDAGDVDGDSIPEIVLEGCQTVYIIKAAANDSFLCLGYAGRKLFGVKCAGYH